MRLSLLLHATFTTAALLVISLPPLLPAAAAHEVNCDKRSGIDRARCERHQRMYAACGAIKGEAHIACDRDYLLANPLDCSAFSGGDNTLCLTERAATKTCEPQAGIAFMRCLRGAGADVMGKPDAPSPAPANGARQ